MNAEPENEDRKMEEDHEELTGERIDEEEVRGELAEIPPPEAPPETRGRRFLRLAFRWLAGLLIVFGLGVLATALLFYRPATQELSAVQRELQGARERIAELESEVDRLQALESENRALEEELEAAELRIQILSALVDVNAARLALADEEIARAQEHLAGTPETLKSLEGLVDSQQREEVTAMQNRLELALEEMERDQFAAQSDLRVLATNLEQLEDTFSANP
jgi:hypothetical protein